MRIAQREGYGAGGPGLHVCRDSRADKLGFTNGRRLLLSRSRLAASTDVLPGLLLFLLSSGV